jgi:OOP family OmpA-OmpF porin
MKFSKFAARTAAAALVLVAAAAPASDQPGQWYLNGMGTGIVADDDRLVDDGVAGGELAIGYALSEHFNLELAGQILELDGDGPSGVDVDQTALSLNLMNIYNRSGLFSPYLLGGVGWVNSDPQGAQDDDNLQLQGGLGVLTNLFGDRFSLRTEALYRWEDADQDEYGDILINVGLGYAFGDPRSKTVDSDGDGVPDERDRCPGTPLGAVVDSQGCELDGDADGVVDRLDHCPDTPRGATVNSVGCPADADGDGVYDGIDQCPNTPAGATVDLQGCPSDGDLDGVYDGIDQCPNTPPNVLVDEVGCGIKLEGVNFGTNSAEILPSGQIRLDRVVDRLREESAVKVVIEGHTDSRGDAGYNMDLSRKRAQSVKDYLVAKGIAADRLRVVGLGETQPVADNATEEGQAQNRRVVLKVEGRE